MCHTNRIVRQRVASYQMSVPVHAPRTTEHLASTQMSILYFRSLVCIRSPLRHTQPTTSCVFISTSCVTRIISWAKRQYQIKCKFQCILLTPLIISQSSNVSSSALTWVTPLIIRSGCHVAQFQNTCRKSVVGQPVKSADSHKMCNGPRTGRVGLFERSRTRPRTL